MKRAGKVLAIVCGALAFVLIALQIVLNLPFVTSVADKYAAKLIDGKLEYTNLHFNVIGRFPRFAVSVDSLTLTYQHGRFDAYDISPLSNPSRDRGRGALTDTLIRADRLAVSVNPFLLSSRNIRLCDAEIKGLRVYAHKYDADNANWNVIAGGGDGGETPEEDSDAGKQLPNISVGGFRVDRTELVFSDISDTLFVDAGFDAFRIRGDFKADFKAGKVRFNNVSIRLDSLAAAARIPSDTLALRLRHLDVSNAHRQTLDISAGGDVTLFTNYLGGIIVPASIDGTVNLSNDKGALVVGVRDMLADIAYVPVSLNGTVGMKAGVKDVDLHVCIDNCKLARVVDEYSAIVPAVSGNFSTDAILSANVDAVGRLDDWTFPDVKASIRIPDSRVSYLPQKMDAVVGLDLAGNMTADKFVSATLKKLSLACPGLELSARGNASDLLGGNPGFEVHADGNVAADSVVRFIPLDKEIKASGNMALKLDARTDLDEIRTLKFRKSVIDGTVTGDSIMFAMPADTIGVTVGSPRVMLSSHPDGLKMSLDLAKAFFSKGDSLHVRVRDMKNFFHMYMVEVRDESVPKLSFTTDDRMVYMKSGSNRFGLFDTSLDASIQMRPPKAMQSRRHYLDSLRRAHPGVTLDSLIVMSIASRNGYVPEYLLPNDFSDHDLKVNLDSVYTSYLKMWKPSGRISVSKGFVSTPVYPLRTRLSDMSMNFTDNEVNLHGLKVVSGMSDVKLKGRLGGLRRVLLGKGMLNASLDISSDRFNINELVTAFDMGTRTKDVDSDTLSETEGSYLVDSIADARLIELPAPLIVVPSNLNARVKAGVSSLTIADVNVHPAKAELIVRDRTAQLVNAAAYTDVGTVKADAFYATRSKQDISLGADLRIRDVSAEGVIGMLPAVDEMIPLLKSFEGLFNIDISVASQLDTNMNVIIPTLEGITRIRGENLYIRDAGNLRKVTGLLLFKDKNIGKIKDLKVDAAVHDGKLEVFPFELAADRYRFVLRGTQGPGKQMNYHASVVQSPLMIPFGINVYGYTDNWRFMLGLPKYRAGKVPVYTQQLDSVQINIHKSIQEVHKRGIEDIRRAARRSSSLAKNSAKDADSGNSALSAREQQRIDSLNNVVMDALAERQRADSLELLPPKTDSLAIPGVQPGIIDEGIEENDTSDQDAVIERRIKRLGRKRK